jgi:uncharacterized phage-associated protein
MLRKMQILKLVYIAHGWHLAITGEPLIDDDVRAWKYGPVIKEIYHQYKHYGNGRIQEQGIELSDLEESILIEQIFNHYSNFSGIQLSAMTHKDGSPWDETFSSFNNDRIIPNQLILTHYRGLLDTYNG